MVFRVLILGGYGNFGSFIARTLAKDSYLQIIVAGRSIEKAQQFVDSLNTAESPANPAQAVALDINEGFSEHLATISPQLVIHCSGPFQGQGYAVAEACIAQGVHYVDLADGRAFVEGIGSLHERAKAAGVLVISGASSVPCLTSALIDFYRPEFERIEKLDYGIATAQKTARGLATTAAILGYTGKPFKTMIDGELKKIYGWQSLHPRKYGHLGWRLLSNCDVPDLALFPQRYPELKTIRFYAGLELPLVHLTLWGLSWLVRVGLIRRLERAAGLMLRMSYWFDWLGSDKSAFHMQLSGVGTTGEPKTVNFELTASSGDGPYIPCMPSILLAKKMANGEIFQRGAHPCMGFITRDQYLKALGEMDIRWEESRKVSARNTA